MIIAHRLSTIKNADSVAVLDQQRVVECGQPTALLGNRQGLFRKLMEKQAFLQEEQQRVLLWEEEEDGRDVMLTGSNIAEIRKTDFLRLPVLFHSWADFSMKDHLWAEFTGS